MPPADTDGARPSLSLSLCVVVYLHVSSDRQVGDVAFKVSEACRLVSNAQARRVDFLAPGDGVYAVRFFHSSAGHPRQCVLEETCHIFVNNDACCARREPVPFVVVPFFRPMNRSSSSTRDA